MSKMRMSIKSQAAMEFLLSYGWAILVVIVVIGALAYFNVLDPTTLLPDKCVIQAGPLACVDHTLYFFPASSKAQFHMKFKNQFDNAVQIKSIDLSRAGFDCLQTYSVPKTIGGGSEACIAFLCPNTLSKQRKKAGFDMQITYFFTSGLEKTLSGDIFSTLNDVEPGEYWTMEYANIRGCPQPTGDGNGDGVIDQTDLDLIDAFMRGRADERSLDNLAYDLDCTGSIGGPDYDFMDALLAGKYGDDYFKAAREYRKDACIANGVDPNWRP